MEVNNTIEKCKNCMSINMNYRCDSVDTIYLEPHLNFPCRYYIDRYEFIKENNVNTFSVKINK